MVAKNHPVGAIQSPKWAPKISQVSPKHHQHGNQKFIRLTSKLNIEKLYNQKKYKFNFIPSHPIAGIEKAGLENGFDGLFTNRYNIICPLKKSSKTNINKIVKFWKSLNMKIEIMSAKEHDKVLSLTSHLPHLISYSLVLTAMKKESSLNQSL